MLEQSWAYYNSNISSIKAENMPFDHYTIGKVIGKGSYGEVYLVKHRKDKKQVVCSVLYSSMRTTLRHFDFTMIKRLNLRALFLWFKPNLCGTNYIFSPPFSSGILVCYEESGFV